MIQVARDLVVLLHLWCVQTKSVGLETTIVVSVRIELTIIQNARTVSQSCDLKGLDLI
jgi:hypothetical protein